MSFLFTVVVALSVVVLVAAVAGCLGPDSAIWIAALWGWEAAGRYADPRVPVGIGCWVTLAWIACLAASRRRAR